jgi:hypothetical protein
MRYGFVVQNEYFKIYGKIMRQIVIKDSDEDVTKMLSILLI